MNAVKAQWYERVPLASGRPVLEVGVTLAMVALAWLIRLAAEPILLDSFPYVTFFPMVVIAAFLFGARAGLLAGVLGGLLSWYFFIAPHGGFASTLQTGFAVGFYVLVVGTDIVIIHWMQRTNAAIAAERHVSAALATTRELLFHELQHRVSNNLQVAAGLLSVQKRGVEDEDARMALDEASRRLALIGRISRQLYDAGGATRKMREFLEPLCADVIEASGRTGISCTVNVTDDAPLTPDAAIPLALIVAEAMANAIEHGFRDRDAGRIDVHLTRDGADMVLVEVRDDGHGLPEGFTIEASDSLGLRIATMLAEQLQGKFELIGGIGTTARLVLPA